MEKKKNNLRNVKSQPLLPSLPSGSVQGGGVQGSAKHMQKHKMLARSQSALHLGHYQFGDHTAHALSKTLGDLSGDQLPLKANGSKKGSTSDSNSRQLTNLDPGTKAIDTLVLRDNGMTSTGFQSLSMTLRGNSTITSLDLRRNKLGTKGIIG